MDRRSFLKTSAAMASICAMNVNNSASAAESMPSYPARAKYGKSPNVLFILSDQHNAKCMGHKNHPDIKTPNFDKLAKQGTRFDACTTANPICTPSRMSFISGQYCHNHGYYGLSGPHPKGLPTIFSHFRAAGYKTAAIGKIHCPANWVEKDTDCFHDTCGTSIGGRSKEYAKYLADRNLTKLEDHGVMQEFGKKGAQTCEGRPSMVSYRDGQEGWAVTKGIQFMSECVQKEEPFFVHISLPKPHQCYTPAKEFWDLYDQSKLTLPPNCNKDLEGKAPNLKNMSNSWRTGHWTLFEPKTFEAGRLRKLNGYLGNISHVDHAVGELVDFLDRTGLSDNTIVVYSSDHGDFACEFDVMEKAPGISADAITRVPMIWRWPGKIKANHVVHDVVETIDTMPTVCALAGMPVFQTADGQDLGEYLKGDDKINDRAGLTEFAWSKSLRYGPWRLVTYPKEMFKNQYPDGFGELYNIDKDPWELKNLYFDKAYADVRADMERRLLETLITKTRPATLHASDRYEPEEGPQTKKTYTHTVNLDGKMHYDRIRVLATEKGVNSYM